MAEVDSLRNVQQKTATVRGTCPGRRGWGSGLVQPGEGAASAGPKSSLYQCLQAVLQGDGVRRFMEVHGWGKPNRGHKLG